MKVLSGIIHLYRRENKITGQHCYKITRLQKFYYRSFGENNLGFCLLTAMQREIPDIVELLM